MKPLKNESGMNPPKQVEVLFNTRQSDGSETMLTAFTLEDLLVIPRTGEVVHLGSMGGFDVTGGSARVRRSGGWKHPRYSAGLL